MATTNKVSQRSFLGTAGAVTATAWTAQMMAWDKANEKMIPAHTLKEQNYFPETGNS